MADRAVSQGLTDAAGERGRPVVSTRLRREKRILTVTLAVSDAVMIGLALWLAWYVRLASGWFVYNAPVELGPYLSTAMSAIVIMAPIFAMHRLYSYDTLLGGVQEYGAVFRACTYGIVVLVFVGFLERTQPLARGWLVASWGFSIALVGCARFGLRRLFRWLRRAHGWLTVRALIVGADEHARAIARQLTSEHAGVEIVGFVDDFLPTGAAVLDGKTVLGAPSDLHELARQHRIEQVIVLPNAVAWETFQEVMQQAAYTNGFEVQLSPGFYEILTTSVAVTHKAFVPLLRIEQTRITGIDLALKTALDFGLGAPLTLLALPLMAVVAVAIGLTAGRPILEYHPALGLAGVPFRTMRFRTGLLGTTRRRLGMFLPKEIAENPAFSSKTSHFLYRTGLDKLPQLFDVLAGRMSLVGPRLVSPDQRRDLRQWLPSLLTVKPGWVGPWAVSSAKTHQEEILMDLYYIRNWTIWLDLQVLFQVARKAVVARSRQKRTVPDAGDKQE